MTRLLTSQQNGDNYDQNTHAAYATISRHHRCAMHLGAVISLSKEQMTKYTAQNPFERFPDGRPKVPDGLLEKLKDMSAEEVLGLNARGFRNQWEAGWQVCTRTKCWSGGR